MAWMISWSLPASAETAPVVFLVDAALDQQAFDLSGEVLLEVSSRLPDDKLFSVIVYDEVIQAMMPLAAMDKSRLSAIMLTLENANPTPTSNLAAGFERALDAFKDRQTGHIVFFSTAKIDGQATEQRNQYLEWFEEILLPDSALKDFAISIVTNVDPDTSQLLQMTASYRHIEIYPLAGDGKTSDALLAKLLNPAATTTATLTVPTTADSTSNSATTTTVKPIDSTVVQTESPTPAIVDASSGEATTQSEPNTPTPGSTEMTGWLQETINLRFAAFVAAGIVLMLLAGLVRKNLRLRRAKPAESEQTAATARSAYLPLDETPSGRLTSYDSDADDTPEVSVADEEARWTNKWTAHAGAAALSAATAEHLASEDTTHIAVSKASPDSVVTGKVAEATTTARSSTAARSDADPNEDEDTTRRTIPAYLDDD